jgi:hypothetical protein
MKKFSLILFSLFSMIKYVSADDFYDFYRLNVNFGFIKDVELWVFMITWGILFLILNGVVRKIPLFREDTKNAVIFSVLISIAAMIGSPISTWMMATVILSPIIIFFLFFIILLWTAISYFLLGGAKASETWGRATSKFRMQKRSFRQIKKLTNKALNLIGIIKDKLNHLPDSKDGDYDSEANDAINTIRRLIAELDKMRLRIKEEDPEEKLDAGNQIRKAINEANNAIDEVEKGNVKDAKGDFKNAEKKIKIALRRTKKLVKIEKGNLGEIKRLPEGRGNSEKEKEDPSKIIEKAKKEYSGVLDDLKNGNYDQKQASDWQTRIWGEFTLGMKKLGYEKPQIEEFWNKEIWSLGQIEGTGLDDKWKKIIQKKIDNINPLFEVDLNKHPKKAKNQLKKIRNDIDKKMIEIATSLGKESTLDAYSAQFNQILDFFEHNKEPADADEKDWKSIMDTTKEYKNFLLVLRDKIN